MCADFVNPQFQNPDFLRSFVIGQQSGQQAASFPGQMQLQGQQIQAGQQGLQTGQLNLDMLRQMMALKQQAFNSYQQTMSGMQSTQTGQQPGSPTGGIQTGPQGSISAPAAQNDPLAPFLDPRRIAANAAYGQFNAMISGKDPNEPVAAAVKLESDSQTYQKTQAQLQAQGPLNLFDSVFNSDAPARIVSANPSLMAKWPGVAVSLGLAKDVNDPAVWQNFTDKNIRSGMALAANKTRGAVGLPAKDYPNQVQNVGLGQGETAQIDPVTGKKIGDLTPRQEPTFILKPVWDPQTGTTTEKPVQTGGYGMQGVGPRGNVVGAGPASAVSKYPASTAQLGFNTGFEAPKDPDKKAAMFASEMRSGLNTLTRMESSGFNLSPKTRTLLINAATSEDEGALRQFASQEFLTHLSKDDQTYIAALMPVLQAAGHDQSGARLTTSQVRQNIESMLPIDVKNKEALTQVNSNREGFYNGLLTQAGSATQLPQYKNTLGADLKQAQGSGSAPASAIAHLKANPQLAPQFKAKYGYLPNGG